MLQNNSNIKSLIAKLWQNFWSGGISNPLTAIEQLFTEIEKIWGQLPISPVSGKSYDFPTIIYKLKK